VSLGLILDFEIRIGGAALQGRLEGTDFRLFFHQLHGSRTQKGGKLYIFKMVYRKLRNFSVNGLLLDGGDS
jgi:hypothetical protein